MSVTSAAYTYRALVTAIYDGDTIVCDIDTYDHQWKKDEVIRLYGINMNEIKRSTSQGRGDEHVETGFDHRDALLEFLNLDPESFPRKVKYHEVSTKVLVGLDLDGDGEPDVFEMRAFAHPVEIIIQTIRDTTGKFGRLLGIIHVDGVNINERLRDIVGGVEFYDGENYPADHPIVPPS